MFLKFKNDSNPCNPTNCNMFFLLRFNNSLLFLIVVNVDSQKVIKNERLIICFVNKELKKIVKIYDFWVIFDATTRLNIDKDHLSL
jgi:hypothetical protein